MTIEIVPHTVKEMAFNQECILKLIETVRKNQPALLYGPPGVGKTTGVHIAGNELQYTVIETNASDVRTKDALESLLVRVRMRGLTGRVIYLFDEVDGLSNWSIMEKIITQSKNPIVLTANDLWKIPDSIKNRVTQIKLNPPPLITVVSHVRNIAASNKMESSKVKFQNITPDFRASINSALWGGQRHETSDVFKDITAYLRDGKIPSSVDNDTLTWLFDNAPKAFHGRKLYEYYQYLSEVSMIRNTGVVDKWTLLSLLASGSCERINYPNFFRRRGVLRSQDRDRQKMEEFSS